MPEINPIAIAILIGLFAVWKLDFIATLLNLGRWPEQAPAPLRDVFDDEHLANGRDYARARARASGGAGGRRRWRL